MGKALSYIVFLHQTTTRQEAGQMVGKLSYIVFLHQTTTIVVYLSLYTNCLISSFYIKPQRQGEHGADTAYCLISSFYIKPQHQASCCLRLSYCLISSFYIKPQH